MKHRVKVQVPVEKTGFFGGKKTVMETRIVEMDDKAYRQWKKEQAKKPYSIEEMLLYDDIFEER